MSRLVTVGVGAVAAIVVAAVAAPSRSLADGPDEERALEAVTIPRARSPSPKLPEWTSAIRVRPTRRSTEASGCRATLLREWLKVRCPGEAFAISLLGGDVEGIAFWIDPATKEGEVLMPLRSSGKHVVQLWRAGKDRSGAFAPQPALLLQEYWLEGSPGPVVTLL